MFYIDGSNPKTRMNFNDTGFQILKNFITIDELQTITSELNALAPQRGRAGIRGIDRIVHSIGNMAKSSHLIAAAKNYLSDMPHLVRAIYFDKSPEHNWLVTWHQDLMIAVSSRIDIPGWGPWSKKEGVWHVQAPIDILTDMVTIRIHLDAATSKNGCLKVIPGSHKNGILNAHQIEMQAAKNNSVYCEVDAGDALVMRPTILHASEKVAVPAARRVLHFEYASSNLPEGLRWTDQ